MSEALDGAEDIGRSKTIVVLLMFSAVPSFAMWIHREQ
jgi:hypothetical protein